MCTPNGLEFYTYFMPADSKLTSGNQTNANAPEPSHITTSAVGKVVLESVDVYLSITVF